MKLIPLMTATLLLATTGLAAQTIGVETDAQRDARMGWWREARFGMFIHWGVYAVPAGFYNDQPVGGIGEWIMLRGKIPMAEYQAFAPEFHAGKFDAKRWVQIAKDAGMKYLIITAKHHDGFAMFDTKVNGWSIVKATPFGRDPLAELARECRAAGLRLGFYYSQAQDWNNGGSAASGGKWDPAQKHDMDDYVEKTAVPQVRELLTNYGKDIPAVLWWDTPVDMNKARAAKLAAVVQELRPDLITNNRLGGGYEGDTETPEQFVPANGFPGKDWETCMTMNNTWGYKRDDQAWKPTEKLIRNLCDIASKGGNYLLNVGPTAEGLIPEPSVERLAEMGRWMRVNGDAIHGTQGGPFPKAPAWGRVTRKGNTLYLLVFDWPRDGKLSVPLLNQTARASLLGAPQTALPVTAREHALEISVPNAAPDRVASVVVLSLDGSPRPAPVPPVAASADGVIHLAPGDATLGSGLRLTEDKEPAITHWNRVEDAVEWNVTINQPGKYQVTLMCAVEPGDEGAVVAAHWGIKTCEGKTVATKNARDFQPLILGELNMEVPGTSEFRIKPESRPGKAVMSLRGITLTPLTPRN